MTREPNQAQEPPMNELDTETKHTETITGQRIRTHADTVGRRSCRYVYDCVTNDDMRVLAPKLPVCK